MEAGAVVIDESSHLRQDALVPLVVPEVNAADISERERGIIASPNCTTIRKTIKVLNLREAADGENASVFPHRIAFNCIPQVDAFLEAGRQLRRNLPLFGI